MTSPRRLETDLPALLADLYLAGIPDYRDDIVRQTAGTRQRPAWTFPERWLPMDLVTTRVPTTRLPMRQIGVLALIALLLASLLAVYVGTQVQRLPAPFGPAANGDLVVSSGGDIVRLDPTTGLATPLVTDPAFDSWAKVSPDGRSIAFVRRTTEQATDTSLAIAGIDGSNVRLLTDRPVAGGFEMIAWAADSRSVLVDMSATPDIWRYDVTAGAPRQQVAFDADAYASPFRPPDGSAILVYRNSGVPRLSTIELATSTETILAEGRSEQDFDDARWSPDGSAVVYHAAPADDLLSQRLFVVDADGRGVPRQITDAPGIWWDIDETWSPDGRSIAFDRYELAGGEWLVRQLAIVDVASGAVREIGPIAHDARAQLGTPTDSAASPGEGMWFEWSPDGRYLVAVPTEAPAHPVLVDVTTGEWRNLDPVIAPDFVDQSWQRLAR